LRLPGESLACQLRDLHESAACADAILQTAFGFWNSKVLLTAVELGLFTVLARRRLTASSWVRNRPASARDR